MSHFVKRRKFSQEEEEKSITDDVTQEELVKNRRMSLFSFFESDSEGEVLLSTRNPREKEEDISPEFASSSSISSFHNGIEEEHQTRFNKVMLDEIKKQSGIAVVKGLLLSPNNDMIKMEQNGNRTAFVVTTKTNSGDKKKITLSGLVPTLREVFYPEYVYKRDKHDTGTGLEKGEDGISRGLRIHEEMCEYVTNMHRYTTQDSISRKFHTYTVVLISALKKWGLTPVIPEFPAFDLDTRIGTRIDLLCLDKSGVLHVVELKFGMDNYFRRGNRRMRMLTCSNSPMNQALLQAIICKFFLIKNYGANMGISYVVNVNKEEAQKICNEELDAIAETLYSYIYQHRKGMTSRLALMM